MQTFVDPKAVIQGEHFRISVLTDSLFRLEYSENGVFTDEQTQIVVNRSFPVPEFEVFENEKNLKIRTSCLELSYDRKAFSRNGLRIQSRTGVAWGGTWYYGEEPQDLGGTARTLDGCNGDVLSDGKLRLEHGLMSYTTGITLLDDSRSLIVGDDDSLRYHPEGIDLYVFGYGHDFQRCLKDYYSLTGPVPLIPRFALGNWWSRYHRYTDEEYRSLISRFESMQIPLSVAVIDMDWHLTDIDPKYGSGWTGYTWNSELFPDYRSFLGWLHEHGVKTALNVHPADGVRGFEAMYKDVAAALGKDIEREENVEFDITDPAYRKATFDYIYHPYEKDGVDFWWLDWQQGGVTPMQGLDPLWMLNYIHYKDNCRDGKRGLTFSRYAGPGSHRFPIGFSGDTLVTWDSLDFQPWFTATASNIGYGWWSHDIGGHMMGYKDEELTVRWIQLGVFSPIMRLHSSNSPYMHKEPWTFRADHREIIANYLRLRHAMLPYLYTMNVLASRDGQPLVRPLYYIDSSDRDILRFKNEYCFGSGMVVCPMTHPADESGFSSESAVIPEGLWYDLFTGHRYQGKKKLTLCRNEENIPVLAAAGSIIPFTDMEHYTASVENPEYMKLSVFTGKTGRFDLLEDDGTGTSFTEVNGCRTGMSWDDEEGTLTVSSAEGNTSCIPAQRTYRVCFYGVSGNAAVLVLENGREICPAAVIPDAKHQTLTVVLPGTSVSEELKITLKDFRISGEAAMTHLYDELNGILVPAQMSNIVKDQFGRLLETSPSRDVILSEILAADMPETVKRAMEELVLS